MADTSPCTCIRNAMDVDCPIHGEAAILVPAPQPEVERIKCNLQTVTASAKTWADLPEILDWYQRDVASLLAAVSPLVPAPPEPQQEAKYWASAIDLVCDELENLAPEQFNERRAKIVSILRNAAVLRAAAARSPTPDPQAWQSMETAPKDGTIVLACRVGKHSADVLMVGWNERVWVDEWRHEYQPTHWMPIQAPPADREETDTP